MCLVLGSEVEGTAWPPESSFDPRTRQIPRPFGGCRWARRLSHDYGPLIRMLFCFARYGAHGRHPWSPGFAFDPTRDVCATPTNTEDIVMADEARATFEAVEVGHPCIGEPKWRARNIGV